MGIALATLIGYFDEETEKATCHVSGGQLRALLELANLRFAENARRVERFRAGLTGIDEVGAGKGVEWEDADARRARKRAEGLQRAQEARREKETLEETKTPLEVAFEDDEHGGENV